MTQLRVYYHFFILWGESAGIRNSSCTFWADFLAILNILCAILKKPCRGFIWFIVGPIVDSDSFRIFVYLLALTQRKAGLSAECVSWIGLKCIGWKGAVTTVLRALNTRMIGIHSSWCGPRNPFTRSIFSLHALHPGKKWDDIPAGYGGTWLPFRGFFLYLMRGGVQWRELKLYFIKWMPV